MEKMTNYIERKLDEIDKKAIQAFKRIRRNPHLFTLIMIQTIVNVSILLFINIKNATVFSIVSTVIVLVIFNLFLNKDTNKKTYSIKKWSVWNESSLITMSIGMIVYYLWIYPYDNRKEFFSIDLSAIFTFYGALSIIIVLIAYLSFNIIVFKFFKGENTKAINITLTEVEYKKVKQLSERITELENENQKLTEQLNTYFERCGISKEKYVNTFKDFLQYVQNAAEYTNLNDYKDDEK